MPTTVAGSVYLATREYGDSVPPGVIAERSDTNKQAVKNAYLNLKEQQDTDAGTPTPTEYVSFICSQLELPDSVAAAVEELLSDRTSHGGNPIAIAAAGVYEGATEQDSDITLREIAEAVTFTKETVWRHASQLRTK